MRYVACFLNDSAGLGLLGVALFLSPNESPKTGSQSNSGEAVGYRLADVLRSGVLADIPKAFCNKRTARCPTSSRRTP